MNNLKSSIDALSEVVSTLLTLMIVLGVVAAVLLWGLPYIEEKEMLSEFQTVAGGFDVMYDTISSMIIQEYGAKGYNKIVSTNELSTLSVTNESSKLVIAFSNSTNPRYHFNVSGLDDGDRTFAIEEDKDIFSLNKVKIYWLDPGRNVSQYSFEIPPYKRVYKDQSCVQPFVSQQDWKLDKIKIYARKRGDITSGLNVSIYADDGDGKPEVDNHLARIQLSASNVPTSYGWIECNFSDVSLTNGETYYIGLNTSSGGFGGGTYSYYEWYLDEDTPYGDYNVFDARTSNDEVDWDEVSGYDFQYRLYFLENYGPNTPEFPNGIPENFHSGTEGSIDVRAVDPEDDDVYLRIFWGDGENSGWLSSPIASGSTTSFAHTYKKPGNYTLTLQAKDTYDTIYESDDISGINATAGVYVPDDTYYDEEFTVSDPVGGIWTVQIPDDKPALKGTLRIDLYNAFYEGGYDPFGRIWVFDLGSISYISPHDTGTQSTIFENGGILTFGPITSNFINGPSFFEEDDALGFRIIQIGRTSVTNVSGYGIYDIKLSMKSSYSREPRLYAVYSLKMQFFNPIQDLVDLWLNYFSKFYNFELLTDRENTILYAEYEPAKTLVLDNSFITATVAGGGL